MGEPVEQALGARRVCGGGTRGRDLAAWAGRQRGGFDRRLERALSCRGVRLERLSSAWPCRARRRGSCARLATATVATSPIISRSGHASPRLSVRPPLTAVRAILGQLQTVGIIATILRRMIRVRLAFAAAQRDEHAVAFCHGQVPSRAATAAACLSLIFARRWAGALCHRSSRCLVAAACGDWYARLRARWSIR